MLLGLCRILTIMSFDNIRKIKFIIEKWALIKVF